MENQKEKIQQRHQKTRRGRKTGQGRRWQFLSTPNLPQDITGINNVLTISDKTLSPEKTSLLSKGLDFCPERHFNISETILDINKFIRNVALKKHYYHHDRVLGNGEATDLSTCLSVCDTNDDQDVFYMSPLFESDKGGCLCYHSWNIVHWEIWRNYNGRGWPS